MLSPTTLMSSSVQIVFINQMSVMCVLVGSDGLRQVSRSVLYRTALYCTAVAAPYMGVRGTVPPVQTVPQQPPSGGPISQHAHSFAATYGEDASALEVATPLPPNLQILEPPLLYCTCTTNVTK